MNKKLTKVLSVFLLAGAIGAGVAGATGCVHSHTFGKDLEAKDGSQHGYHATCGHDVWKDLEDHVDVDENGKCDGCGVDLTEKKPDPDPDPDPDDDKSPVKNFRIFCTNGYEVEIGKTLQFSYELTVEDGADEGVIWSSQSSDVASIDENGLVMGVSEGLISIKGTPVADESKYMTINVRVVASTEGPAVGQKDEDGYTTVYRSDYRAATVQQGTSSYPTEAGVYGASNASDPTMTEANAVKVVGDNLEVIDTSSSATTYGHIRFADQQVNSVKLKMTFKVGATGGNWKILTLYGADGEPIAYGLSDKDRKFGLSTSGENGQSLSNGVAYSADQDITLDLVLDLVSGKISGKVTVGTTEIDYTGENAIDIGATSFSGISFMTASSAVDRKITLSTLVVSSKAADASTVKATLLANLEAAYAKYNLEEDYTYNGALVTEAYNTGKAAIEATGATTDGMSAAYGKAIADMADVISDADTEVDWEFESSPNTLFHNTLLRISAVFADRTISSGKTINGKAIESNYDQIAALDVFESFVIPAMGYGDEANSETLIRTKSALAKWEADGMAIFNAIKSDNAIIAEVKAEAKAHVDELAAAAKATEGLAESLKTAIDNLATSLKNSIDALKVDSSNTANDVIDAIIALNDGAEADIQKIVNNSDKDLPTLQAEYEQELITYAEGKLTGNSDEELTNAVNAARDAAIAAIKADDVTKENIDSVLAEGKAAIDKAVTDYEAAKALAQAKEEAKADLDSYKQEKLQELNGADESIYSEISYTSIDNAADAEALDTAKAAIKAQIDAAVEAYKAQTFKVSVKYDGHHYYTVYKQYGSKLTLSEITIVGFKASKATVNGAELGEDGVDVYGAIEVIVTEIAEDESTIPANLEWVVADDAAKPEGATKIEFVDNGLIYAYTNDVGGSYGKVARSISGGKSFTNEYISSNVKKDAGESNKATPYVIVVKASLSKLTVYLDLTDSGAKQASRGGIIHAIVNGVDKALVTTTSKTDMLAGYELGPVSSGDEIRIYISDVTDGARLCLFGIDAELDADKSMPQTVSVTWTGVEGTHLYRYNEEIIAPAGPDHLGDTEKFEYWYYMDEDQEVKWVDGTKLASGEYTFLAKISTVAAVEMVDIEGASEVEIGKSITLTAIPKDIGGTPLEGRAVVWSLNGYEHATLEDGVLTILNTATAEDTITVTATVGTKSGSKTITVKESSTVSEEWRFTTSTTIAKNGSISSDDGVLTIADIAGQSWSGKAISASANDKSFDAVILGKSVSLTSTKDTIVTIYITFSDSNGAEIAKLKEDTLTFENATSVSLLTKDNNVDMPTETSVHINKVQCVAVQIELKANTTCKLTYANSNRLNIWGVDYSY